MGFWPLVWIASIWQHHPHWPPPYSSPHPSSPFTHSTLLLMQFQLRFLSIFEYVSAFQFDLQSTPAINLSRTLRQTPFSAPPCPNILPRTTWFQLNGVAIGADAFRRVASAAFSFRFSGFSPTPTFPLPPRSENFYQVYSLVLLLSSAAATSCHLIVFLRFSFCDFLFDFGASPPLDHLHFMATRKSCFSLTRKGKRGGEKQVGGAAMLLMMLS